MQKNVSELLFFVFLFYFRKIKSALMKLLVASFFLLFSLFPLGNTYIYANQNKDGGSMTLVSIRFNSLIINRVENVEPSVESTFSKDLKFEPLTIEEENLAKNLNSHWAWPENTLSMIDSYSPFLFRTKKSQELDEVIVVLNVNSKGVISDFEVLGKVDKGLKERLDHMIRKMPACKPVPGYSSYTPAQFQLTIKK
jgi:hypothetical protein